MNGNPEGQKTLNQKTQMIKITWFKMNIRSVGFWHKWTNTQTNYIQQHGSSNSASLLPVVHILSPASTHLLLNSSSTYSFKCFIPELDKLTGHMRVTYVLLQEVSTNCHDKYDQRVQSMNNTCCVFWNKTPLFVWSPLTFDLSDWAVEGHYHHISSRTYLHHT